MPELPEVETIRNDLSRLIVGKKILEIATDSPKQVQPSLDKVKKAVGGERIQRVERKAKLLQIFLSNDKILIIHLKLTGRLLVRKKSDPKDDWQHVVIFLDGGLELRFADMRKFGWIRLIDGKKQLEKLLLGFGPEPLTKELTLQKFAEILSRKSLSVKQVLMDQTQIAGIGNIYANDALFLAGIDPRKKAKEISHEEVKKLYQTLTQVLQEGIKYRGASDQAYLDALGKKGSYQKHFRVYGKANKPCSKCSVKIKRITLGGRGTFFCPACQAL